MKESSDGVRDLQTEYLKKKTDPSPVDGPSFLLGIVADELDMYSKILHDPKGWWDNDVSTPDKVGLGLSAVPGLGLLGKAGRVRWSV